MIYLIITTSVKDNFGLNDQEERKNRYLYAISETLKILPDEIIPVIVENNGSRITYLDNFKLGIRPVRVIYTDNNKYLFKSKGINEMLDIKTVIDTMHIQDDDIIIKLTGRYRVITPSLFLNVIKNKDIFDAFIKFFGTCSLKFEPYDCILGYYAIRVKFLKLFNPFIINNYNSAEIAFAKYTKLSGIRINEIENLDIECCFGEDKRILLV